MIMDRCGMDEVGNFLELLQAIRSHIAMAETARGDEAGEHFWHFVQSLVDANSDEQVAYLIGWLCIAIGSRQLGEEIAVYRNVLARRN